MAKCSPKLFGYNLECTRRVGYGGIYAEMIYNNRLLNQANGFYDVEIEGLKGLGQCTERLQLITGKTYEWKILAGADVRVRVRTEYGRVLLLAEGANGCFTPKHNYQSARFEVVSDGPIHGYELNIDDYAAICRYAEAEMEYTVGLRHGDPGEAAALVEYCNGNSDTQYGALRVSRGYPEPYHVKTWYVGNELGYGVPAEVAAKKNDIFTETMVKTPNGEWMNIESGEGELKTLPPSAVAFIRFSK